jgi:tetratricopeptide (TPR) repeat protein
MTGKNITYIPAYSAVAKNSMRGIAKTAGRLMLIIPFLLMFLMPVTAQEDTRFAKANELYTQGKYEEAAKAYEEILKTGVESPELYYNLGNAYYKSGLLPQAILN